MKKDVLEGFKQYFHDEIVQIEQIREYFQNFYENLSESSFLWRIYELKRAGVITKLSSSIYRINQYRKKDFQVEFKGFPQIFDVLKNMNSAVMKNKYVSSDELFMSAWDISILNQFMTHQVLKDIIVIEGDKYRLPSIYDELKTQLNSTFFVSRNPKKDVDNLSYENEIVFVLPLPKRSPIDKSNAITTQYIVVPKMEKILVDLVANQELTPMIDSYTVKEIMMNFYKEYNLDFTTLLYYARNRGIRDKMAEVVNWATGEALK